MSKMQLTGVSIGVLLFVVLFGWIFSAPYLSNQGLGRTPGFIIGGTLTEPLDDFSVLEGAVQGPLIMKQAGFPPFSFYLSWVAEEDGIITATRPDGGYWEQRVYDRGGDGWLRIGDQTFAMEASLVEGAEGLRMMERWASKSGRSLDEALYEGSEPLREWKVFFWRPR